MKILKFGGTSVGSAKAISALVNIVKEEKSKGEGLVVVCSAMSGITNSLLNMAERAVSGSDYKTELYTVEEKHYAVIHELLEVKLQNPELMNVKIIINELDEMLHGLKVIGELSTRVRDSIASFGEQLSCMLISAIMEQHGLGAMYTDARQLIVTDNSFGNANVLFDKTNQKIKDWYDTLQNKLPVVTGFIASNETGYTTTLGRGGSDYTAAIIGGALSVSKIEIWTDVDGFMTADPRLVKKAFTLNELSYREAMELSYFGAKVIYPPTMIPAIEKQIPVVIKNTFNPSAKGTIIHNTSVSDGLHVKGISSVKDICLLNIEGSGMIGNKGFSARLFGALARNGVNIMFITQASSEHSITLAINPEDKDTALLAVKEEFHYDMNAGKIDLPQIETNLSIVAVVGEGMRKAKGISGKVFNALGRCGINVVAIAQGSSEINISVIIRQEDIAKALNALHDALFLSGSKTLHVFCAGTGNIGKEFLNQIYQSAAYLEEKHHLVINVMGICNSRKMMFAEGDNIALENWQYQLEEKGEKSNMDDFVSRISLFNLPNSVFVDNTASASVAEMYTAVFEQNVSVVACNKIATSGPYEKYSLLKQLTRKYGVDFYYETNVGAGLPIIKTLNDLLISGDTVLKIEAIMSGTLSFIFNNYKGNRTFADVVKEAQEKGYTEPDPRDDLNGRDFSRKMLILSREMGFCSEFDHINIDPILPDNCLKAPSIEAFYKELSNSETHFEHLKNSAEKENKVLRYIGAIENGEMKIAMQLVDNFHPFYGLTGSDNIISFTTLRYKNNPLVVKGPGAGASVTAAGVFADIVRVAQ